MRTVLETNRRLRGKNRNKKPRTKPNCQHSSRPNYWYTKIDYFSAKPNSKLLTCARRDLLFANFSSPSVILIFYFMTYFSPISQHGDWSEITSHNPLHWSVTKREQFIALSVICWPISGPHWLGLAQWSRNKLVITLSDWCSLHSHSPQAVF